MPTYRKMAKRDDRDDGHRDRDRDRERDRCPSPPKSGDDKDEDPEILRICSNCEGTEWRVSRKGNWTCAKCNMPWGSTTPRGSETAREEPAPPAGSTSPEAASTEEQGETPRKTGRSR